MAVSTLNEDELKADAKEYAKWRSKRIGSSDIPVILGESPFKTPHQLWLEKTGRVDSAFYTNFAIELGKQFEDTARVNLELKLDIDFPPTIMVDDVYPFLMSSLDGYNEDHEMLAEFKCVQGGPTWIKACAGLVSDGYKSQVQHQLHISKCKRAMYYVSKLEQKFGHGPFHIADTRLVEVYPDKQQQERIIKGALEFHGFMTTDTPPPLMARDVMSVDDDEAVKLLGDKPRLVEYVSEKYNHTNFNIKGSKLIRDVNGVWRLTLNKG